MSFLTILTRTLICASILAIVANIFVINSSATLGEQVSQLDQDMRDIVRINNQLTTQLVQLHDIERIAHQAQELGFFSANTAMRVTLPDSLAMQP